VILDLGDIITHEAVQRSYDAGMLDTLLANVYQGQVTFDRDEMKVGMDGTSTVEKASGGATVVDELATKLDTAEQQRAQEAEQRAQNDRSTREQKAREREERAQARDQSAQERQEADQTRQMEVAAAAAGESNGDG
jgi:alpha-acetolactate decarboxylase